jgi:hypothetical protein
MALCPRARSGDTNVVIDVFADTKLFGVSRNAENSRCDRSLATDLAGGRRRPNVGLHQGKCK